jgi:parvulin-like peptidyl-prolyl isomerase
MKKFMIVVLAAAFGAAGCGPRKEAPAKIPAGTPAYNLAKESAKVIPALDPDLSTPVVSTKGFNVTAAEVIQMLADSMGSQADQFKSLDAVRMKGFIDQAAVQMAERKLLLAAAAAGGIQAGPEEVQAAMDAQYARAGGEAQYAELAKQSGVNVDFVKRGTAEDLTIQKYLDGVVAAAGEVTEAEARKAYDEDTTASVRHILLLTQGKSERDKAEVRKKMEEILDRAKGGEDFAELAKQYSEDEGSKANGGLYEDFGRGRMVKPFEDAAFSVPVGEISGIVETTFGYHILKVEDRKKETRPFEEARADLEAQVKRRKQSAAVEAHMDGLKDKAAFKLIGL